MLQSVLADKCNSGSNVAGICVTENLPDNTDPFCTPMATGLACTTTGDMHVTHPYKDTFGIIPCNGIANVLSVQLCFP